MRPEEKLHRAIWSAIDEIAQEKLATPDDEWVLIGCHSTERKRAVQALVKSGAIKIVNSKYRSLFSALRVLQEMQGGEEEVIGYYIDTIEPRYTEMLDFYYDNIGKRDEDLIKGDVAKVTDQLKTWQGSKPAPALPEKNTSPAGKTPEKKIEKLTVVEKPKHTSTFKVVVNDNYNMSLPFDANKNTGGLLLKLAEKKEPIPYSEHKQPFDHLNSPDSQLVTKTGCVRTKILASEAGQITPIVEIEMITEKQFKQRSGKPLKNA
ncbi:hypothetical protein C4568_01530 [Candidatus Parcubacteria bacterium]|nr:MAG: hypothetical protein C4568_01530 [Candidatus Parcubacteria bacterium]